MLSRTHKSLISIAAVALLSACGSAEKPVSFAQQVKPILDKNCLECHTADGAGTQSSGLEMTSYATLMKGTKYGPVIVAGNPESSTFYRLIAGLVDPSIRMPHGKEAIPDTDIKVIEAWIQQGAKNN